MDKHAEFETVQNGQYVTIYKANYRRLQGKSENPPFTSETQTHTVQLNSFCERAFNVL